MNVDLKTRRAGVLVPVFALRRDGDLGIGDVGAVREMVDWCVTQGLSVLQLLPINETGADNSPYNAISSQAIDPTTLTLEPGRIPGLTELLFEHIATPGLLDRVKEGPVNYAEVKALKLRLLWASYQKAGALLGLNAYIKRESAWIGYYTLFRFLMDVNSGSSSWESWPEEHRTPDAAKVWLNTHPQRLEFGQRLRFYAFLQWLADEQWTELRTYAESKGVLLMGDIPFGVNRNSCDVWAARGNFDLTWSGGAPPEPFFQPDAFTARWGQNWGIPCYDWAALERDGYAWWQARVRATARYFHTFRIDHVLGFYRIYGFPWQPSDNEAYLTLSEDEARARSGGELPRYLPGPDSDPHWREENRKAGEARLRAVQAAAGNTAVVAEDLGTVPDYVPASLASLGIPGFKIPLFERHDGDRSYKSGADYPELSIATFSTHDHLPLAAQWTQWQDDIEANRNPDAARWEQKCLMRWMGGDENNLPPFFTADLHLNLSRHLLRCNSGLVIFQITDWFGWPDRFNVPGPVLDSNWSMRLPTTVAGLHQDPGLAATSAALRATIRETGRFPASPTV